MGETLVVSASLGGFDAQRKHSEQFVECHYQHFTDENFPPRFNAMTPRLQARIVKMFSWQMAPGYTYYLWVDSSCRLASNNSVRWFLSQLGDKDIALFKHPHRSTVQEEGDYLKQRLAIGCPYITPRYENELIDEQLAEVSPSAELYASTAFIYRDSPEVRAALKEWWHHTSRFHSIDQLSLPWAIRDLNVRVIPDSYLKTPYLEYVRNKG